MYNEGAASPRHSVYARSRLEREHGEKTGHLSSAVESRVDGRSEMREIVRASRSMVFYGTLRAMPGAPGYTFAVPEKGKRLKDFA